MRPALVGWRLIAFGLPANGDMRKIVECVPNFSEGRRREVVDEIVRSIASVPGAVVLDREMDADHNRSVVTFVGDPEAVARAAVSAVGKALELIDMREHRGAHPRIGATDVVPFVPISGVDMAECVRLAEEVGRQIAERFAIPVYLYEEAARRPERRDLAHIRKGEFEGLAREMETDPERRPDFGEPRIHPTAGATAVGARAPLIAYNVYLNTDNVDVAKKIAKAVRFSSGGLRYVKALGMEIKQRQQAQVSMNMTNFQETPLFRALEMIRREAARYGVAVTSSEIVGLVPQQALDDCAEFFLQLENFSSEQVLERKLERAFDERYAFQSLDRFLERLASSDPVPGGGSAAALAASGGAALAAMVCNLTAGKAQYEAVEDEVREMLAQLEALRSRLLSLVEEDARAYAAVVQAYRLPKGNQEEAERRKAEIQRALRRATEVPLETADSSLVALKLVRRLVDIGNRRALSDAGVAAALARAAIKGAAYNVNINLAAVEDQGFKAAASAHIGHTLDESSRLEAEIEALLAQELKR